MVCVLSVIVGVWLVLIFKTSGEEQCPGVSSWGPFSHNPVVVAIPPATLPLDFSFLMLHIGRGCASTGSHSCNYDGIPSCTNGTTPFHPHPGHGIPTPPNLTYASTHLAATLDGPWLPMPSGWSIPQCSNNPAPLFLANGSLMIMCHSPLRNPTQVVFFFKT